MLEKKTYRSQKLYFLLVLAYLTLLGCSGNRFSPLGAPNSPDNSMPVEEEPADLPKADPNISEPGGDELATPPQVITGAYLVCAEIQPSSDSDPATTMLADKIDSETAGFGCGMQNKDGTKNSAKVKIESSAVTYADDSREILAFSPAPEASRWHISFLLPRIKLAEIASISLSGSIDDQAFDSNTTPLPAQADPGLREFHLMFVTHEKFIPGSDNDFVGLRGADELCTRIAVNANLRAQSWRAVLMTPEIPLSDRIIISKPVRNIRGETISNAAEQTAFFSSNVLSSLDLDEWNMRVDLTDHENEGAWTGVVRNKSLVAKRDRTCEGWTSDEPSEKGSYGGLSWTENAEWLSRSSVSCAVPQHLYCISQFNADQAAFYQPAKSP